MKHYNKTNIKYPDISKDEKQRLQELNSYNIIGENEQEDFDFLTRMAAGICGTKISLISLITEDKQWFLSHYGLETRETSKDYSFCAHAINTPDEPFIVKDARKDERFHDNPLVTGNPNVIFYAGIPLVNENNTALGSICVIDDTPHTISDSQLESLRMLANQVIKLLEHRRKSSQLDEKANLLEEKEELLQKSKKKLLESEHKYKVLFENSQGLLCTHNRRGILININKAAANSLGYKTDELIGQNLYDLLPPELTEKAEPVILSVIDSRISTEFEYSLPYRQQERHYLATVRFLETLRKTTPSVTVLIKDVTEKTLQKREIDYRQQLIVTLADISQDLLNTENLQVTLENVLKNISLTIGADQCYYFEMKRCEDDTYCKHILEYISREDIYIRNKEGFKDIPASILDVAKTTVTGGKVFQMNTSDIPNHFSLKEIQEEQGILSFLYVPMVFKSTVIGFIGFDSIKTVRVWNEYEIGFLQSVAVSIASAIEKHDAYQSVEQSYKNLKEAHIIAKLGRWEMDHVT